MRRQLKLGDFSTMSTSTALAILVCGLPGSGKTFFAKRFAPAIGAAYFSSDIMRKTMSADHAYTPREKANVYTALLERMGHALRAAQTVVIDATFYKEELRNEFVKEARSANTKVVWIEVLANKSVVRDRLQQKPTMACTCNCARILNRSASRTWSCTPTRSALPKCWNRRPLGLHRSNDIHRNSPFGRQPA